MYFVHRSEARFAGERGIATADTGCLCMEVRVFCVKTWEHAQNIQKYQCQKFKYREVDAVCVYTFLGDRVLVYMASQFFVHDI